MLLQNNLNVDIKIQDRYRQWLSTLLQNNTLELSCVMLGDSDIDYELTPNMNNARILNAPYNTEAIKYPLIYNGVGGGVKGSVTAFARYVDSDGNVSSYYNYPANNNLTIGRVPPSLQNGFDIDSITFTNERMGVILFFQTLLDYYRTDENIQQRLNEPLTMKVFFNGSENVPNNWQVIKDVDNNSLLIAKNDISLVDPPGTLNGLVQVIGTLSKEEKLIEFNI